MFLKKAFQLAAVFVLLGTSAAANEFDFTTVIPLTEEPSKIVISEENEVAVVVSVTGRVLIVANIYEEAVVHEILLPAAPVDIVADPNNNRAIITSENGLLLVYDLFNGALLNSFTIEDFSHFIAFDKKNNTALLGNDSGIKIVNIDSGNSTAKIELKEFPLQCFVGETALTVLSQGATNSLEETAFHIRKIDSTSYEIKKEISFKGKIESAGLDESLDLLLLTLENVSGVLMFDNATLEPAGLVSTDKPGRIITVDSLRSKVFLVNQDEVPLLEEGSLSSVSLMENRQVEIIPLPEDFGPVAVSPEYNRAIVALGNNLTFVRLVNESLGGQTDEQQSSEESGDPGLNDVTYSQKTSETSLTTEDPEKGARGKSILPYPEIVASKPDKISQGTSSFTLRVLGKNFLPNAFVTLNGRELPTKFLSSTVLEAQASQDIVLDEGTYPVIVTNFAEMTQQSNVLLLSVVPAAIFLSENLKAEKAISYGSLAGTILSSNKSPIAGATIRTKKTSTVTNESGEFVLDNIPAGKRTVFLDGSTALDEDGHFPTIPITVEINPDIVNPLPFQPYLHRQKNYNFVDINPVAETILTDQEVPGFEMRIPAGVNIIGWDGKRNLKVSVRTVPTDRLPVNPLPQNAYVRTVYMFYFEKIGGGIADRPIPITAKNDLGLLPGEKAILWYYDESPIEGDAPNDWAIAGTGTVSPDGKYIGSDPGVGIPKFCCGATAWGGTSAPNQTTGKTDPCKTTSPTAGDPVDLATGYFLHEHTDFVVPGVIPIRIKRYYRSQESVSGGTLGLGAFGRGTYFEYDWWLNTYEQMLLLITPGNTQYRFDTLLPDGTYINTTDPAMRGVVVSDDGTNKILKMRNGWQYTFNSYGELVQIADRNSNTLTIERMHSPSFDEGGYISRIITSEGKEVIFNQTYTNVFFQTDSIVASNGMTVTYSYEDDPFSSYPRLKQVDSSDGEFIQYGYDSVGRINSIINKGGVVEVFNEYDANDRVISQTHPDGGEYDFTYTAPGNFVTETVMTTPNGAATSWRFNTDGYITEKLTPDGTSYYDRTLGTNETHTITDPLGRTTSSTFYDTQDATNGLIHSKTDTLGNVTTFEYETTYGFPTKITNAQGKETNIAYTFDTGRLTRTEVRDPLQNLTSIDYDTYGMPVTVTDPNNNSTTFSYDAADHSQLVAASDPLGNTVSYGYNSYGRLSAVTAPDGSTVSYEYNSLGRLKFTTNPEGKVTRYFYDQDGNLIWLLDPNKNQTFFEYDDRDRFTKVTDQLGRIETYSYYRDTEITPNTGANLKTFTDRKGQVTTFNEYGPMGRLGLVTFGDLSTIQYTYDDGGRLVTINDSISGIINYTYNDYGCGTCSEIGLDRIAQETTPLGTIDYAYDTLGRRTSMTLAGSPIVDYTYDDASRLSTVDRLIGSKTKSYNFEYDPAGRRISRNIFLYKKKGKNKYVSSTYGYDNANNLINLLLGSVDVGLEDYTFTYNENGLRKTVEMTGVLPQTSLLDSASFDAANEMLVHDNFDFSYDANGNITYMFDNATQEGTTYTWDARNRLVGIDSPQVSATFTYDALNRRTEKSVNGVTTQYVYDGRNVIKETRTPGQSTDYIHSLNIDEPLYLERADGTIRYFLADALGSVVALADGDTGDVTTSYSYDAFGTVTINGSDENPFQYTGRENDGTGLYYYRARYYNPTLRRFISEDPIGLAGGMNFYSYVQNNPVNFIDPYGLWAITFGPGVSGGVTLPGENPDTFAGSGGYYVGTTRRPEDNKGYKLEEGAYLTGSAGKIKGGSAGAGVVFGFNRGDVEDLCGQGSLAGVTVGPISLEATFDANNNWTGFNIGVFKSIGLSAYGAETHTRTKSFY